MYQVDGPKYGGAKNVIDLTDAEAKDELCDAMDLIARLIDLNITALQQAEKARYLPKGVLT